MTDDELMHVYIRARNGESLGGLRAVAARARAEALAETLAAFEKDLDAEDHIARVVIAERAAAIRARAAEGGERG